MGRVSRLIGATAATVVAVLLAIGTTAAPAEAHVLPTSTVVLDVHEATIDAALRIPLDDLEAASGIDLGDDPATDLAAHVDEIATYIGAHFAPTSSGETWAVSVGDLAVSTSEQLGTGTYTTVTAVAHLVPSTGTVPRTFDLGYDVVIEKVVTHMVMVSVRSDWVGGDVSSAREVGTIQLDPVTGTVPPLTVDLGASSIWKGFAAMVGLGASHIREGVDHQLFLLTLLLPAPLLVRRRRWAEASKPRSALRRIAAITLAFTIGHSVTLALGALGPPVPQHVVEALIAVSILVAVVHAVRPIFAGREALIAGGFGLIHGMAFSATLTELDLSGRQLVVSLLGFNVGIELIQLAIVALVLPPLCVLARHASYSTVRSTAAALTAVAATGWLVARLGLTNPVATFADGLVTISPWIVLTLWSAAALVALNAGRSPRAGSLSTRPSSTEIDRRTPVAAVRS